ncbi:MFS transporter [Rhodococcus sp. 1168]|uniref:MFS transporter n=1 Tax=Rhodococcus sp. 1168 TaxID=2018041 RepID=UPI000A0D20CA|nr:MFS transporter [Rhodococcus sp. 1168]ORI25618.1 MFS transporter [Rhodococcus sp. 1168]
MTEPVTDPASEQEAPHPGRRRVLTVLCLTEITSWGILYYAFPVLSPAITADTGWSTSVIVAAFSLSQLVAALVGIPVGRILDRHGPRWVMTAGSVIAAPALVVVATSQSLVVFYLGWTAAGVAMGAVLYPPAFAALTRWWGTDRVRALMILTLAAGLASTVFAPLTALLSDQSDWRRTYVALTGILLVVTVPGHLFGLRGRWPKVTAVHPDAPAAMDKADVVRSRPFVMLTASLSLAAFVAFAGVFNLVPLLIEHGADPAVAATALGLGGLGQVLGRVGYLPLQRFTGVRGRTVGIIAATALTTLALGVVTSLIALVAIAVGAGLARGVFTLIQATAITDRWGPAEYGHLNGIMSAPIVITMAIAPWAGSLVAGWTGSYSGAYIVLGASALASAALAAYSVPKLIDQTPQQTESSAIRLH